MKIDSHLHVYPNPIEFIKESHSHSKETHPLKKLLRKATIPYNKALHTLQEHSRILPEKYIPLSDRALALMSTIPSLLDCTPKALDFHMDKNELDYACVIAHPPFISNDFVMNLSSENPKIIPIVNIPKKSFNPCELLENYIIQGAKALKIHAAADGHTQDDPHYHKLLKIADQYKLPVIIHTGCIHLEPIYNDPQMGHAQRFESWFEQYSNCKFILAHMNYHYPEIAIEMAQKYKNVYMDTSWQPAKVIAQAIDKIGSEKIMFGSDWPLMGSNIEHALAHIEKLKSKDKINELDYKNILGLTAAEIFQIK